MRHRLTHLQRAEIGRAAREAVGDGRQRHTAIHCGRSWLQSEVELVSLIEFLHAGRVLRVESAHVDEDVVVHGHAVLVLPGRGHVISERRKPLRRQFRVVFGPGEIRDHA